MKSGSLTALFFRWNSLESHRLGRGALTLVIDEKNGAPCTVAYTESKRRDPEEAICDLRCREGTIPKRIGFHFADGRRRCELPVPDAISKWAAEKSFDAVIWTGLSSNFDGFSVDAAIRHLNDLSPEGKIQAAEYLRNAPDFIRTPLRVELEATPWLDADHKF